MSLSAALAGMITPGPATSPTQLLAAVATLPASLDAYVADHVDAFDAVDAEFGFIGLSRFKPTSQADVDTWSSLFPWTVAELRAWRGAGDPHSARLLTLLVLVRAMRPLGPVWPSLAPTVAGNAELALGLDKVIRLRRTNLAAGPGAPEWERQVIEDFLSADRDMDWVRLSTAGLSIRDALVPSWVVGEAASALAEIDPTRLESSCSSLPSVLDVTNALHDLPTDAMARLAASTTSDRVRFLCVERLTERGEPPLAASFEPQVVQALVNAAGDPDRWLVWMRTFAPHPVRHPGIQRPLGLALARAPAHAREA